MADSVINGAIGKSPVIDKMKDSGYCYCDMIKAAVKNANEAKNKTTNQMAQHVCGQGGVRYPTTPISFQGCGKEIEALLAERRKGKKRADVSV